MNENVDLTKILKDCPKGERFWSPLFGEVEFDEISKICNDIYVKANNDSKRYFNADGTITIGNIPSQAIMLYPSKDQRDWSKFKIKKPKFDPKTLNPFDKVLVRDRRKYKWACAFFQHITKHDYFKYGCIGGSYEYCIPYNDDTKHLVGTNEEAPEYYRYWED